MPLLVSALLDLPFAVTFSVARPVAASLRASASWALAGTGASSKPGRTWALRLVLDAPDGCREPGLFYAALARRLPGAHEAVETAPEVEIHLRLRVVAASRVAGDLWLGEPGEEGLAQRSVEGASCGEVLQVLSLTAALALEARAHQPPPTSSAPPTSPRDDGRGSRASAPSATSAGEPRASEARGDRPGAVPPATSAPRADPSAPERARPASAGPGGDPVGHPLVAAPPVLASAETAAAPADATAGEGALARAPVEVVEASATPPAERSRWQIGAALWGAHAVSPLTGLELDVQRRLGGTPLSLAVSVLGATDAGWLRAQTLDVRLVGLAASLCHDGWRTGPWELSPCAFALGSWLKVEDAAIDHPSPHPGTLGRSWAVLGAEGRGSWAFRPRARLTASLRLGPALVRRQYSTEVPEVRVGETPLVLATFSLGVAWEL